MGPRLQGVPMHHQAVNPFAKRPVTKKFHREWMTEPFFRVGGSEGLGSDNVFAINVRGGGHFSATGSYLEGWPRPKLAHGLVGPSSIDQIIARVIAVGFDRQTQSVPVCQNAEMTGVVVGEQFRNGLPPIPKESLGDFQIVHDSTRDYRQEWQRIISTVSPEFLAEPWSPILRANLPTVNVGADEGLAGQWADSGAEPGHQPIEHSPGRLFAQFVTFQAAAGRWRGVIVGAGAGVTHSQDRPRAIGHVPMELAAVGEFGRKVQKMLG